MSFLNRRHILIASLAGLAGSILSTHAYAHRKKRAVSTIEWNEAHKLLEITHILHLHDVEQGLNKLGKISKPDLTPLRARAILALYVNDNFSILHNNNHAIPLEILGAEIENNYAYVYQQVALKSSPSKFVVKNTLLQDIYLDQTNLVNISVGNNLKSLIFVTGDAPKTIAILK